MGRRLFYGWVVVAVPAVVVVIVAGVRSAPRAFLLSMTEEAVPAGWIAIIAGFAALAIRRVRPDSGNEPGLPTQPAEAGA